MPGSKGERRYAWAWIGTASDRHFLLIRRSLSKPSELAYFYCYVPEHTPATLSTLVTRWYYHRTRPRKDASHSRACALSRPSGIASAAASRMVRARAASPAENRHRAPATARR
jgi:hypothetical protein